jgi:hypothetical protein
MSQTEQLYSARQLSDELGITLQMLSVYAKSYTQMTKQQIGKKGRLGRHFTAAQREVIKNAREMVQMGSGVTVDEAMRKALVFDSVALELPALATAAPLDLESLKAVLSEVLRDEIATPLIAEIRLLRSEVAELKQSRELSQPRAEKENSSAGSENRHGPLVKFSLWLESWLRR